MSSSAVRLLAPALAVVASFLSVLAAGPADASASVNVAFHVVNQRGTAQATYLELPGDTSFSTQTDGNGDSAVYTLQPGDVVHFTRVPYDQAGPGGAQYGAPEGENGVAYTVTAGDNGQTVTITLPNGTPAAGEQSVSPEERWLIGELNQRRAVAGRPPLVISGSLSRAAAALAQEAGNERAQSGTYTFPPTAVAVAMTDWGWPQAEPDYDLEDAPFFDPKQVLAHWDGDEGSQESGWLSNVLVRDQDPGAQGPVGDDPHSVVGIGQANGAWMIYALDSCPSTGATARCETNGDSGDTSSTPFAFEPNVNINYAAGTNGWDTSHAQPGWDYRLNGYVDPNGCTTSVNFQVVNDTAYQASGWAAEQETDVVPAGSNPGNEAFYDDSTFTPNTLLHARIHAVGTCGATHVDQYSPEITFTTPAPPAPSTGGSGNPGDGNPGGGNPGGGNPPPPPPSGPAAPTIDQVGCAYAIDQATQSAYVTALIDPHGANTTYWASPWDINTRGATPYPVPHNGPISGYGPRWVAMLLPLSSFQRQTIDWTIYADNAYDHGRPVTADSPGTEGINFDVFGSELLPTSCGHAGQPPDVTTAGKPNSVSTTRLTVHGTVNAKGQPTIAFFEYWPPSYCSARQPGCQFKRYPDYAALLTDGTTHTLTATLPVTPGLGWAYRLVAINAGGETDGPLGYATTPGFGPAAAADAGIAVDNSTVSAIAWQHNGAYGAAVAARAKRTVLGRVRMRHVNAGVSMVVVRLSKRAVARMRRAHAKRVSVQLTITVTPPRGKGKATVKTVRVTVSLTKPAARKHRKRR